MGAPLSPAEAVLFRTGPNNITVLFEATGGFDPARALRGIQMLVQAAERFQSPVISGLRPRFGAAGPVDLASHVAVLNDPAADTAQAMMNAARKLRFDSLRPLWRIVLVNPEGGGWSGVVLHFDHAIADGTRIARLLVTRIRPGVGEVTSIDGLPVITFADLRAQADPRLDPAPTGLCRLPFDGLSRAVPEATGHGDALARLGRRMLDQFDDFAGASARRKDHTAIARIEALRNPDGGLGNHAQMQHLDLSKPSVSGESALFRPRRTPLVEQVRMGAARLVPALLLRRMVQAEFSLPGIVMTIVPVARKLPPIFGLPLNATHPAAPALGRPLLSITAARTGDGFDTSITAHGPDGTAIPGLSERVAAAMVEAVQ